MTKMKQCISLINQVLSHRGYHGIWTTHQDCFVTYSKQAPRSLNSLYVEQDAPVQQSWLDPNVTDEILPRTTFHLNSIYHVVAAASLTRQPCYSVLNCCMDQQVVNMAPYYRTMMMQQDPTYWTCGLLSLVVSCASARCLSAFNKQTVINNQHTCEQVTVVTSHLHVRCF